MTLLSTDKALAISSSLIHAVSKVSGTSNCTDSRLWLNPSTVKFSVTLCILNQDSDIDRRRDNCYKTECIQMDNYSIETQEVLNTLTKVFFYSHISFKQHIQSMSAITYKDSSKPNEMDFLLMAFLSMYLGLHCHQHCSDFLLFVAKVSMDMLRCIWYSHTICHITDQY